MGTDQLNHWEAEYPLMNTPLSNAATALADYEACPCTIHRTAFMSSLIASVPSTRKV